MLKIIGSTLVKSTLGLTIMFIVCPLWGQVEFLDPVIISTSPFQLSSGLAQIAISQDGRAVSADYAREEGLYSALSTDGGRSFTTPARSTWDSATLAIGPRNQLYLAYVSACQLTFISSDDYGRVWSQPRRMSGGPCPSHPHIAVDAMGRIGLLWRDQGSLRFSYSLPEPIAGWFWRLSPSINDEVFGDDVTTSLSAAGDGNFAIVWDGVFFQASRNFGQSWQEPVFLGTGSKPSVALDNQGNAHITWVSDAVQYSQSSDQAEFTAPIELSQTPGIDKARIAAGRSNQTVFVAWSKPFDSASPVELRASTDSGETFGPTLFVSSEGAQGMLGDMAPLPNGVGMIYFEGSTREGGILFRAGYLSK